MSARRESTDDPPRTETPPAGALQRLLEVERRADEALVRARAEAREIVEGARERAHAAEAEVRRDLSRADERLEREIRAWRDERLAILRTEAEASASRYEEAASERAGALADLVLDALLDGREGDLP